MIGRTLGAAAIAAALVLGLGACGGGSESPAGTTPSSVQDARATVDAEHAAAEEAARDAEARALAGECTDTGQGSEFLRRGDAITIDSTAADIQGFIAWLESAPEGCTQRDQKWLTDALAGMESYLATR